MPEPDAGARRSQTRRLMFKYLVVWPVFGLAVHLFVDPLNRINIPMLGFRIERGKD